MKRIYFLTRMLGMFTAALGLAYRAQASVSQATSPLNTAATGPVDKFKTIAFHACERYSYDVHEGGGFGFDTVYHLSPALSVEEKSAYIQKHMPFVYAFIDSNGLIYDIYKKAYRNRIPCRFDLDGWPIRYWAQIE